MISTIFLSFTAVDMAFFKSSIPIFLTADNGTTLTPKIFSNLSTSISIPKLLAKSILFKANNRLTPISINCKVRYKFLSKAVASTILTTKSGFSFII